MNDYIYVHVNIGQNEFTIFNVYLPCNSDMLYEEFENRIIKVAGFIESCLEIIPVGNKHIVIVCGDFNASITKLVTDRRYAVLSKILNEVELYACDEKDVIGLDYTFRHKGLSYKSLIDHLFVCKKFMSNLNYVSVLEHEVNN